MEVDNGRDERSEYQGIEEPVASCFEITIEDDAPPVTSTECGPIDTRDDDGDKMFGRLIVGELRKMTPAAQKEFKRNVTGLLYT